MTMFRVGERVTVQWRDLDGVQRVTGNLEVQAQSYVRVRAYNRSTRIPVGAIISMTKPEGEEDE